MRGRPMLNNPFNDTSKPLRWRLQHVAGQSAWLARNLDAVPGPWRERVRKIHATRQAQNFAAGNRWLLDVVGRLDKLRVPIDLSDSEIIDLANKCAREVMDLAGVGLMTLEGYRERAGRYCERYGIAPPETERVTRTGKKTGIADGPAVRRMTDSQWWRRKLRQAQARALEGEAIELGYVHRRAEIYASDVTVERRAQQKARNAAMLEATEAINQTTGEIYRLSELVERSVSLPRIRRGELMTRIAGFEAIATGLGHAAEFVTLTAPSRFHPKRTAGNGKVMDNPKWTGETPRETQQYLGKVWARCRAKLNRYGISVYGFRIAEPHHDGTPHWHGLFFMPRWYRQGASMVARFRAIVRRYFLREDAGEQGARENRCKFVAIDAAKGTAAGYIAKYVSKNIDGYQVQSDIEGENLDAVTGSQRVEAWAATWGIRQFQQIGGPPVGVWRELRRMRESVEAEGTVIESARAAADAGNWRRYVELQGGPVVARNSLALRTAYTRDGERWDAIAAEPMPAPMTKYGEVAKGVIYGVRDVVRDRAYVSRFYQWEIRRAKSGSATENQGGSGQLSRGRPSGVTAGSCASAVGFQGGEAAPWTRVNNCTQGETDGRGNAGTGEIAASFGSVAGGLSGGGVGCDWAAHGRNCEAGTADYST